MNKVIQMEAKNKEGQVIGSVELPVEKLLEAMNESASLRESSPLTELKEELSVLAKLSESIKVAAEKTIESFTPEEKSAFVIDWMPGLDDAGLATLAEATGLNISKVTEAEEAEVEETQLEEAITSEDYASMEEEIKSRYKFLENLGTYILVD